MRFVFLGAAMLGLAAPAAAAVVTIGGELRPGLGLGLFSMRPAYEYWTFDLPGAPLTCQGIAPFLAPGDLDAAGDPILHADRFNDSVPFVRRMPGGLAGTNDSCFMATITRPNPFGGPDIEGQTYYFREPLRTNPVTGMQEYISYIGFMWGSVDEYNMVYIDTPADDNMFYASTGIALGSPRDPGGTGILNGEALMAAYGLPLYSDIFVNIDFDYVIDGPPPFISFFNENGITAFEIDNLTVAWSPVPAAPSVAAARPATAAPLSVPVGGGALALVGLGLAAIAGRGRGPARTTESSSSGRPRLGLLPREARHAVRTPAGFARLSPPAAPRAGAGRTVCRAGA